ncbi:hypothetical protein ACWXVL_00730 [Mycoplasma sp. 128]
MKFSFSLGGSEYFWKGIKNIFTPYFQSSYLQNESLIWLSFKFLLLTIQITLLGTILGASLALLTALVTNYKTNNKYWSFVVKVFMLLLRSIPEIIYIYLFVFSFHKQLATALLISWFTWIWLHKFMSEAIENLDVKAYNIWLKKGFSKTHVIVRFLLPQLVNKFVIYILYSFESNMRWTSVFSFLGLIGIGELLNEASLTMYKMHELLIPLLFLVSFIFGLEWLSHSVVNKNNKSLKSHKTRVNSLKKFNLYESLKWIFLILILIFVICSFVTMPSFGIKKSHTILNDLFNPNWKILQTNENVLKLIFDLLVQVFVTIIFCILFSYVNIFLTNNKTNKAYFVWINRFIFTFIRIIPTLTIFYIFWYAFSNVVSGFVFAFALHSSTVVSKQINEAISKIETNSIETLKKQGWNKLKIFNSFILASVKVSIYTFLFLEIEKNIRNFINYGTFGASGFGLAISYGEKNNYQDIAPYVWISLLLLLMLNLVSETVRYFYLNHSKPFFLFGLKGTRVFKVAKSQIMTW